MKFINNKFETVEYQEELDINKYILKIIQFINKLGLENEIISQIYLESDELILEYTDGKTYEEKYNGEVGQHKIPSSAAAFCTLIEQKRTENGFMVIPGIVLRNRISDNLHIFTHELFHALSSRMYLPYDNNGINYTKSGFIISYYDKEDNQVGLGLKLMGLTEGMTELMTRMFCNEKGENYYHFQLILCSIILNSDNSLINAYFSRNDNDVKLFIEKILNNQSTLNFQDLVNLPKNIIFDKNIIYKYLKGFIEYSLNVIPTERLDSQIEDIKNIVSELDNDLDYSFNDEYYSSLVNQIIEELNPKKL